MEFEEVTIKDLEYLMEINNLIEEEDYGGVKEKLSDNPQFAHRFYTIVGGIVAFKKLTPYLIAGEWDIEGARTANPEIMDFMDYLVDTFGAKE